MICKNCAEHEHILMHQYVLLLSIYKNSMHGHAMAYQGQGSARSSVSQYEDLLESKVSSYLIILVCSDSNEAALREVLSVNNSRLFLCEVLMHNNARKITVHGVETDLQEADFEEMILV